MSAFCVRGIGGIWLVSSLAGVNCGKCGKLNDPRARFCQYCGKGLIRRDWVSEGKPPTPMPIIGGILLIASTVLTLWGVAIGFNQDSYYWGYYYLLDFVDLPDSLLFLHGLLAILGLIGGFSALFRKHFGLAFVGGLCGAIGLGIGVALAGLLFILVSAEEFESRGFIEAHVPASRTGHVEDYAATYGRRL